MKHLLLAVCLSLIALTFQHCPTQPEHPPEPASLTGEYITATEVWLRAQAPDSAAARLLWAGGFSRLL